MTTITRFTKEQLIEKAKENVEFFRERLDLMPQSQHVALSLHLAEITLASLEAEPKRNPVLVYADSYRDMAKQGVESIPVWSVITDLERNIAPLYTAPPAPVVHQEPIAWLNDAYLARGVVDGEAGSEDAGPGYIPVYREPLYAVQPAPVVPEELLSAMEEVLRISDRDHEAWHKARNGIVSCRAAMLQGSQPVSNRDELREQVRREHAEWSDATFGDVGPVGPLKHLSKEALEAAVNPEDSLEWADMQLLLWDAQRRMGLSDDFITRAMIEKLAINKTRQWPEPKDGEPRMHIKETGNSPVIPDRWIPVSERVPESNGVYFGWDGKRVLEVNCFFGGFSANQFIHGEITHWMPLPAAPQQEVNRE